MLSEAYYIWKCDTCNVESRSDEKNNPPKNWRQFSLCEFRRSGIYAVNREHLIDFVVCEKCHGDKYRDMHPIRKALSLAGVFKK